MIILEQFSYQDIAEFKRDFILLMRMTSEIDREYGSIDPSFLHNLPEYTKCLELFSKKYRDIVLKPNTSVGTKRIQIFFDVKSIRDVFDIAIRIDRLEAVGRDSMNLINIKDRGFEEIKSTILNKVYLKYFTSAKSKTIILKLNEKEKMPELIYDKAGIVDDESPEFKLCSYYGCLNGFDKKIDIKKAASAFCKKARGLSTPTKFWR